MIDFRMSVKEHSRWPLQFVIFLYLYNFGFEITYKLTRLPIFSVNSDLGYDQVKLVQNRDKYDKYSSQICGCNDLLPNICLFSLRSQICACQTSRRGCRMHTRPTRWINMGLWLKDDDNDDNGDNGDNDEWWQCWQWW